MLEESDQRKSTAEMYGGKSQLDACARACICVRVCVRVQLKSLFLSSPWFFLF